jgi:aldehyde dehydrogenase (NAD+)
MRRPRRLTKTLADAPNNLINGERLIGGDALARHPGIDMISFTGSVRAGVMVAQVTSALRK